MTTTEGMVFCRGCGGKIHHTAPVCPHCGYVQAGQAAPSGQNATGQNVPGGSAAGWQAGAPPMGFGAAIKTCFQKYATFEGRAARPEYWYFYLFTLLASIAAAILKLPDVAHSGLSIAFFVPSIAVAARRLHDMGRSGWNQLWVITVIGIIPVVYWLSRPGTPGPNRYGPPPAA